ncbi:hypothetical protein [Massilia sp. TWR1-2-2]|uniref:hypothetical protein n=1 Tax=Massilia sp. TWR1-2-2 TaxID=2804584 RepID=UPI003CECC66A
MNVRPGQVPRLLVGGAIAVAGLLVLMDEIATPLMRLPPNLLGALPGGAIAALATALGTTPGCDAVRVLPSHHPGIAQGRPE